MRIGIMGVHYGHISGMIQSALQASNGQIVGLVEEDDARCARYASIPRFATLDDMIARARPELILEGLIHHEKTTLVETCARAGIHLLLDKPLCRTLDDWERMRRAVAASPIHVSMWFTSRSYPPFIALRQAILDGALGTIASLISTHPHKIRRATAPAWYFDPNQYTGAFHDLACHGVDQIRWLTNAECVGVHALTTCKRFTAEPRLDDHVQASFELSDGALATLTADWLTPQAAPSFGDTRLIVMGTAGSAHLRAYAEDHLLIATNERGPYAPDLPEDQGGAFVANLIDAIERGTDLFIPTRSVFATAQACLLAQESARQGGTFLRIPPFAL